MLRRLQENYPLRKAEVNYMRIQVKVKFRAKEDQKSNTYLLMAHGIIQCKGEKKKENLLIKQYIVYSGSEQYAAKTE